MPVMCRTPLLLLIVNLLFIKLSQPITQALKGWHANRLRQEHERNLPMHYDITVTFAMGIPPRAFNH